MRSYFWHCVVFLFRTLEELGVDRNVVASELCSSALYHFFIILDSVCFVLYLMIGTKNNRTVK